MTEKITPRERGYITYGKTHKIGIGCGTLFVTVNSDEHGLLEVFVNAGKSGSCKTSQLEAIGRLISLAFRSNVDIKSVIKQLSGIRCSTPNFHQGKEILSCADAIAEILKTYQ